MADVLTFGIVKRTKACDIKLQVRTIRKKNPEYPGKSGISGLKSGVSGFSQAPENWTELESILVTRFVPEGLGL